MTKHKHDCKMAFGRKDPTCPRCRELLAGANPRTQPWRNNKAEAWARWLDDLKKHDCQVSGCGPVCTWGDP